MVIHPPVGRQHRLNRCRSQGPRRSADRPVFATKPRQQQRPVFRPTRLQRPDPCETRWWPQAAQAAQRPASRNGTAVRVTLRPCAFGIQRARAGSGQRQREFVSSDPTTEPGPFIGSQRSPSALAAEVPAAAKAAAVVMQPETDSSPPDPPPLSRRRSARTGSRREPLFLVAARLRLAVAHFMRSPSRPPDRCSPATV